MVEITGATLLAALENAVSKWPATEGRFCQVSGIKFSFDPSRPAGARIAAESVTVLARRLLLSNALGPIVFVTPELGKWSTVGGLGVMVDELSVGLAELGANVVCVSPFYHVNRKGVTDYLKEGQVVRVKVLEADEKGRMRLSMKALLSEEAPAAE